jgi:hypothetical protein
MDEVFRTEVLRRNPVAITSPPFTVALTPIYCANNRRFRKDRSFAGLSQVAYNPLL